MDEKETVLTPEEEEKLAEDKKKIHEILGDFSSKATFIEEGFDFSKKEEISRNHDGTKTVYKIKSSKLDKEFAIKVFTNPYSLTPSQVVSIRDLKDKYYHSNIISYDDIYSWETVESEKESKIIIARMELCEETLEKRIQNLIKTNGKTSDMEAMILFKAGLDVADYLHNKHQTGLFNIKPANILISKSQVFKFSDFGMAQQFQPGSSLNPTKIKGQASNFMAPEYFNALKKSLDTSTMSYTRIDIYSLGICIYTYKTLKPLDVESQDAIEAKKFMQQFKDAKGFWKDYLQKYMICYEPSERKNTNELKGILSNRLSLHFDPKLK